MKQLLMNFDNRSCFILYLTLSQQTGRSRGFAFVYFKEVDAAVAVIMNIKYMNTKYVTIKILTFGQAFQTATSALVFLLKNS